MNKYFTMTFEQIKKQLLPLMIKYPTLGIFISGGFDSGLLLYLCCLIKQQENLSNKFDIFTVPRHDDSIVHANRIVSWINSTFNMSLNITTVGNPDLHHSMQVWSGVLEAHGKCDVVLLADTTNPAHLPNGPVRQRVYFTDIKQPFFDLTKKDIIAVAIDLNLVDLMELSHTCTESKLLKCAECWQCQERIWGFSENNYLDPGTM